MVSPHGSPRGRTAARSDDSRAGKGWGSKRTPGCNGRDTGCDITRRESGQTSPWSFFTRAFDQPPHEAKQMTVPKTGAASRPVEPWDSTDWSAAAATVRRLQARIVKATREGRWNKVKALQRLLTHSRSGKLLAVKRVTESNGKETPGVDGRDLEHAGEEGECGSVTRHRGYPNRVRRGSGGTSRSRERIDVLSGCRRSGIERCRPPVPARSLDPVAETNRGTPLLLASGQAIVCGRGGAVLRWRSCGRNPAWVLEGDIKGCFDNIDHDWLLRTSRRTERCSGSG